ncbi:DUF2238 domain-containing protein [Streptomyces sp. NPDC005533]|uniref:DUF2238 domain-containing protein n=1 Tax=Streptomyces sp. NPDC005533 TaxID=3364723 RepID=UPI003681DAD3
MTMRQIPTGLERFLFACSAVVVTADGLALGLLTLTEHGSFYLSHLGIAGRPTAGLFHAVLSTLAVGLAVTAAALFPSSWRSGQRMMLLVPGCLVLAAVGATGVGTMPCSAGCPFPPPTATDLAHVASAVLLFGSVIAAMLLVGLYSPDRGLRAVSWGALAVSGQGAIVAGAMGLTGNAGVLGGAFQHLIVVAAFGWFFVLIVRSVPAAPASSGAALTWMFLFFAVVAAATWWQPPWPLVQAWHAGITVVALVILGLVHRRRSIPTSAWAGALGFLALHLLASRWLYSHVPYEVWSRALTGVPLGEALGWERNHFDRLVHFSYGVAVTWVFARTVAGHWHSSGRRAAQGVLLVAVGVVLSTSVLYELAEWSLYSVASPASAEMYNGLQGDVWDAHKDMALALLGSIGASGAFLIRYWGRASMLRAAVLENPRRLCCEEPFLRWRDQPLGAR